MTESVVFLNGTDRPHIQGAVEREKEKVSLTSLEKSSIRTGPRNKQQTLTSRLTFSSLFFSSFLIVRSTTYSGSCRVESKKLIDMTSLEKTS